jgi:hypothetical protein
MFRRDKLPPSPGGDGRSMFLRNVGKYLAYPRILHMTRLFYERAARLGAYTPKSDTSVKSNFPLIFFLALGCIIICLNSQYHENLMVSTKVQNLFQKLHITP